VKNRISKTLTIFYILCCYVLLQFGWWAYQLVQLNKENISLTPFDNGHLAEREFLNKLFMIFGEGVVFLILIIIGAAYILRSFRREIQLARRQQNFLLSITHELKTPISTIKLYLQTLLKRDLDEVKKKEAIDTMLDENERLYSLVGKMLLAAKMEDSTFSLSKEKVNVSSLVLKIAARLRSNHLLIETNLDDNVEMNIDSEAIDTALSNLIDNAIKYSAEKILVSLTQTGKQIVLSVADDGQGIADEEKERIFQRFYRVGSEDTRKTKGTGLGLYIVKTLVEMHNGVISVSNNSSKGSIFAIQFNVD